MNIPNRVNYLGAEHTQLWDFDQTVILLGLLSGVGVYCIDMDGCVCTFDGPGANYRLSASLPHLCFEYGCA